MVQTQQFRRLVVVGIMLITTMAALVVRLWYLQIQESPRLLVEHERNTKRLIVRQPRRGEIRDIRGHTLATSVPVKTVCADPTLIGPHYLRVAQAISPVLKLSEEALVERLRPKLRPVSATLTNIQDGLTNITLTNFFVTNQYIVLKRKVSLKEWEDITLAMKELQFGVREAKLPKSTQTFLKNLRDRAIFAEEDQLRVYPNSNLLAHTMGFVGPPDPLKFTEQEILDPVGLAGRLIRTNEPLGALCAARMQKRNLKLLSDPLTPVKQRLALVLAELNRLVSGPLLVSQGLLPMQIVPAGLREMLAQPMSAEKMARFNRLLLEQTLTNEVTRLAVKPDYAISLEGKYGVEQIMDGFLRGAHGWRRTELDMKRRELTAFREQNVEPEPGRHVILTIDARIQEIVEDELAKAVGRHHPAGACAIAIRPSTGEILALAIHPTFDPNKPGDSPQDALRNRAITDIFEPGSTFKIVVISGALDRGETSLQERFDCENGAFIYAGKTLHDAGHHYGILSVQEILMKSSNIGSAKVGIKMGQEALYDYIRRFGFGERTGIPLEGEVRGLLRPVQDWKPISISRIPMGQEVAVTPIQMVMAMSAIANGGRLMRPMLISRVVNDDGLPLHIYEPQMARQVISPAAARLVTEALKTVVSKDGTGKKARLDYYTVAGKTGTAQKSDGHRYLDGKYVGSFLGFYPADQPEICIGVFLDEPQGTLHYGGDVAAPAWKEMAERIAGYWHVRPDLQPEPKGGRHETLASNHLAAPTPAWQGASD